MVGFISGSVKLYLNNGDFTFKEGVVLTSGGKPINAADGGPCITDWDGDGVLDLLLGEDGGNVLFYKSPKKGATDLVANENHYVIPKVAQGDSWKPRKPDAKSPSGFAPARPASRVKPFAADWNGDGKLDLLVGDFVNIETKPITLTDAQKKELEALEADQAKLQKSLMENYERIQGLVLKQLGKKSLDDFSTWPKEEQKRFQEAYSKAMSEDKEMQAVQKQWQSLFEKISKYKAAPEMTGHVWVYLRK